LNKFENLEIAVLHDYISQVGGAEKVAVELADMFSAHLITTDFSKEALKKLDTDPKVKSLGNLLQKSPLKQIQSTFKFSRLDLKSKYDLVIYSGNWAHFADKSVPNIWYCHTPTRAFYDNHEFIYENLPLYGKMPFKIWSYFHRKLDKKSVKKIDDIVVNSENTRKRVKKYYGKDSKVIYPPIKTKKYYFSEYGNFWLSVNRLYPEKRIELQIRIFERLPEEKLKIVGSSDASDNYVKSLKSKAPENVEFLGEIEEKELVELYSRCKGLIATAKDEDFGMAPLEAMASGKPILAVDEGGFKESITEDTGILLDSCVDEFVDEIKDMDNLEKYKENCLSRASDFDIEEFKNKIKKVVKSKL